MLTDPHPFNFNATMASGNIFKANHTSCSICTAMLKGTLQSKNNNKMLDVHPLRGRECMKTRVSNVTANNRISMLWLSLRKITVGKSSTAEGDCMAAVHSFLRECQTTLHDTR